MAGAFNYNWPVKGTHLIKHTSNDTKFEGLIPAPASTRRKWHFLKNYNWALTLTLLVKQATYDPKIEGSILATSSTRK
jgi:hypothetical protein